MKKIISLASFILIVLLTAIFVGGDSATMSVSIGNTAPVVESVTIKEGSTINPNQGSDKTITIETIISDTNGYADITGVTAYFAGANIPTNGADSGMVIGSCTQYDSIRKNCTKTYNMKFYDNPVVYTINVTATDALSNKANKTGSFTYNSLKALHLDAASIDFGTMTAGSSSSVLGDTSMATTSNATIQNEGNVAINVGMNATNFISGSDTILVTNAGYRFSGTSYIMFTGSKVTEAIGLAKGAASYNKIDFNLTVPVGSAAGSYTSTVYVTAE